MGKAAIRTQSRLTEWNARMNQLPRKALLVLCAFGLAVLGMAVLPYVWPFAAAFLLSRILEPFVQFAAKGSLRIPISRRLATVLGMALLFGLAGAALSALVGWLLGELAGFVRSLPQWLQWVNAEALPALLALYERWRALLPGYVPQLLENALAQLGQQALALSGRLTGGAWSTAASIPNALLSTVLLVMSTYYFTADRQRIAAFLHRTFPPSVTQRGQLIRASLLRALLGQLRSQATVSLVVTFFLVLLLGVAGVRYGAIIGVLIGLADALPLLGAGLFLIPWALISLLAGQTGMGVLMGILYIGTVVIRQILEPRLLGRHLGIYPLATMAAMYAGYRLMGFAGLLGGPVLLHLAQAVLEADRQAGATAPPSTTR